MVLCRGWGHATSCLNASWINELTVTADPGIWDQLYPASNAHPYFDSLGESSSRFLLWMQVIINTHKQLCLSCRLFKRGINKYNPLQWGPLWRGSSWRWHWALVLFASSSLIRPRCLAGVSWRNRQDTSPTQVGQSWVWKCSDAQHRSPQSTSAVDVPPRYFWTS